MAAMAQRVLTGKSLLVITAAALCCSTHGLDTEIPGKTHLLFVVADDHGFHDPSFTGSRIQTPTIDRLRASGVALEQYYVQKVCSPSRQAFHTGRYPHRNGMQTPFCGGMAEGLNLNETLLPEYLNSIGYESHAVGKWHLGFTSWEHTPTFRGYSSFYGFYNCAEDYFFHGLRVGAGIDSLDFHFDSKPMCGAECSQPVFEAVGNDWQHYSTTLFSDQVVQLVDNYTSDKPLFVYFASQDTHGPAEVPACYRDRYNDTIPCPVRRTLAGKLTALDSALANITAAYDRKGFTKSLLIVYTADNGGPIYPSSGPNAGEAEDAIGASNFPLRGGKHNAYEGGVRATGFITGEPLSRMRALQGLPVGPHVYYHGMMHAVDWLPTLCEALGCSVPNPTAKGLSVDGVSHWKSIINNSTSPRTRVVLDIENPTSSRQRWPGDVGAGVVRIGDYKLHVGDCGQFGRPGDWSPENAWANVTQTEPSTYTGAPYQLFDVVTDPGERNDLINDSSLSAVVNQLKEFYAEERKNAVYPFTLGPGGHPVYVNGTNPNPLAKSMPVWLPWLPPDESNVVPEEYPYDSYNQQKSLSPPPLGFKVVDAHVHLITTTNGIDYLWGKNPGNLTPPEVCPCRPPCLCNWTLQNYHATSQSSWEVESVIFCEVDAAHDQWLKEATWVQSLADAGGSPQLPHIGAIVAQPPPGFLSVPVGTLSHDLDTLQKVKLVTGVRPSFAQRGSDIIVTESLDELGRRGLLVDLNMPLNESLVTAKRSPGTRFVIEHFGGADLSSSDPSVLAAWQSLVRELASLKNVVCLQLGGVMGHFAQAGTVNQTAVNVYVAAAVAEFGFERLCFEGNWFFNNWPEPHMDLSEYGKWASALVSALHSSGASASNLRSVLRDNSMRVYRVVSANH